MAKAIAKGYAKINLVLDVLGKRDDGYHEVAMVMQTVDLADWVSIEPAECNQLSTNHQGIPVDMNNLAMKAVALLQQHFPQLPPLKVTLQKEIPVAAGLAGGSTDCAAVLLGVNQLFALGLSLSELETLGAQLGSDVPFCLGGPTALATGRGEIIQPLPDCPKLYMVLVKPDFGVSTAQVYQQLSLRRIEQHPSVEQCIAAIEAKDRTKVLQTLGNVLEHSTFHLYPAVAQLKAALQKAGGQAVLMSGSGPTVFAAFIKQEQAKAFYEQIRESYHQVFLTETIEKKDLAERVQIR